MLSLETAKISASLAWNKQSMKSPVFPWIWGFCVFWWDYGTWNKPPWLFFFSSFKFESLLTFPSRESDVISELTPPARHIGAQVSNTFISHFRMSELLSLNW